ncbi:hypothetical protein B0H14DRAFT_2577383 [Mycena olivaceomarginata]|nr:hypothetical protein B0H14DRAFT_2577383 [Mycena olivaceomarginata]
MLDEVNSVAQSLVWPHGFMRMTYRRVLKYPAPSHCSFSECPADPFPQPIAPMLLTPPATATKKEGSASSISAPQPADFLAALQHMCTAVVAAESEIMHTDTIAGDSNCSSSSDTSHLSFVELQL